MTTEREQGRNGPTDPLVTALGVLSVGLGLAEVAAPATVARWIGMREDDSRSQAVLRGFGMRELASGFGLLRAEDPTGWLWSRFAGDVMDLAFLGTGFSGERARRGRLGAATAMVAAVAAVDYLASRRRTALPEAATHAPAVRRAIITINKSPAEVYAFWRRLENLPRFMTHLRSVVTTGERSSHWVVEALGTTVEWDAAIVEDIPESHLAWRVVSDAPVPNSGSVTFRPAPGGRGTEVALMLTYEPPAGRIGELFATLLGADPGQHLQADLRRLKQLLETGEIPTTVRQPTGTRSLLGRGLERLEHRSQS